MPNAVALLVEAGRNLRPPSSKAACDPLVVVRCGGKAKQSKAQKRTNNPKWHFQVQMENSDPHELVVIEVSGTSRARKAYSVKRSLYLYDHNATTIC